MPHVKTKRPRHFPVCKGREDKENGVCKCDKLLQLEKLSILRYPGGKGWLTPIIFEAVQRFSSSLFIEPFAGGASVGLSVLISRAVEHLILVEKDERVAAFWHRVFNDPMFYRKARDFDCNRKNVEDVCNNPKDDLAFWTLVKNRCSFGGLLDGGLLNKGDGRGVQSRWNGDSLAQAILMSYSLRNRVTVIEGDGIKEIEKHSKNTKAFVFCDPPYSLTDDGAGHSFYRESLLDHDNLFRALSGVQGEWLASYDNTSHAVSMADRFGFYHTRKLMWTRGHKRKHEILITRDPDFGFTERDGTEST